MKKVVLLLLAIGLIFGGIKLYDKINVTIIGRAFCDGCNCLCEDPDPAYIHKVAKRLINVNEENFYGKTTLDYVCWNKKKYEDTFKLLISKGAHTNMC